jgi:hypothetical protein
MYITIQGRIVIATSMSGSACLTCSLQDVDAISYRCYDVYHSLTTHATIHDGFLTIPRNHTPQFCMIDRTLCITITEA